MLALVLSGTGSPLREHRAEAAESILLGNESDIMSSGHSLVLETERLAVRTGTEQDIELLYALWTSSQVMTNVFSTRPACDTM